MGANHSNAKMFARKGADGKAFTIPTVLPPHKVHSSSSLATMDSDNDEMDRSPSGAKVPFQDHEEDNRMFRNMLKTYECGSILGKGSSAQVFEVIDRATGTKYACKVVHKNHAMNDERTITTETEIMKRVEHSNVARLHELYETSSSTWYIMELATAGSLLTALSAEAEYSEEVIAASFRQVLQGVLHLHEMGVVHRDLKQDNILCALQDVEGRRVLVPKIVDFGLSAVVEQPHFDAHKMKAYRKLKQIWGTREYFAPEVYAQAYGPQADVWSLGCVLYELLTGETPFPVREKPGSVVERYLLNGGHKAKRYFELRPAYQALSTEARDLIHHMLKVNPRKRLSVQECLAHPFITECADRSDEHSVRGKVLSSARVLAVKRAHSKALLHKQLAASLDREMQALVANVERLG